MIDPDASQAAPPPDGPADLALGAFTPRAPWIVDPSAMPWRFGVAGEPDVDTLRRQAADLARVLVHPQHLPSLGRVLTVAWRLGLPLLAWGAKERGTPESRAGLSRRLRPAFEHLGPTYIKLGQIISSGEGIFPEELVQEFHLLRDRVPPEPFAVVRRTIEEDLGRPLAEVFTSFDRTPLASASIAQVHSATLRTGERVVVKVQRSRVAPLVRLDIAAMAWIAPFLVGRIPVAALTNPPALVELFAETIVEELDFRLEAQNMLDIAEVFAGTGQRTVVVPRPHPELVTRRVLVMEHLHGFPWSDAEGMRDAGIDTAAVLRSSLIAFLEGALLYGVFHGDLHGGNLLVQSDGTVALLDFGITARLDEKKRQAFLRLQMGASTNNVTVQVEALRDLGALPADSDIEAVIRDLNLDRPPIDPTTLTAEEMMAEVREVTKALLGLRGAAAEGADAVRQEHAVPQRRHGRHGPRRRHPGGDPGRRHLLHRAPRRAHRPRGRLRGDDRRHRPRRLPGGHGLHRGDGRHHLPRPAGAPRAHRQAPRGPRAPAPAACRCCAPSTGCSAPSGPDHTSCRRVRRRRT